jgi:hypothetical protein
MLGFHISNMLSGLLLVLIPAMLIYFLHKKERGVSDPVLRLLIGTITLLGVKKITIVFFQKWYEYPRFCTAVDMLTAFMLLILFLHLPQLILRILDMTSRETLITDLHHEKSAKTVAQDSETRLKIENAAMRSKLFQVENVLDRLHQVGSPTAKETVAEMRDVLSRNGGSHNGD